VIAAVFVLLGLGGVLFTIRLVLGPNLSSRVVALDGLVITIIAAIAADAARTDSAVFLDAVVVVALVGFIATAAAARYIEDRGD
jgi:multisubunit Na+/H+ antiporter MnhF subunit